MTPSTKKAIVLLSVATVTLITVGSAWALRLGPFASGDRGPVIATVDGVPIYLDDARNRAAGLSTMHNDSSGPLPDEWKDQVLQSLVDDVLVQQEADRRGLAVPDQEVARGILDLRAMFTDLTEYQSWLDSQQMDEAELERRVWLQALTVRVYESVTSQASVSDEAIKDYYTVHRDEFQGADGSVTELADVRIEIERKLVEEEKGQVYAAWLEEQRATATVVVVMNDWWRSIQDEQQS